MQLFALPATHTRTHTLAHTCSLIRAIGVAVTPPLFPLLPTLLGNSQQLHFMRTELDTQVRHANIFALELPRVVQLPKGQLGASWADRAKEVEGAWLRAGARDRGCLSNCCSLYANFCAYSICMSCIKKGQSVRQKTKK